MKAKVAFGQLEPEEISEVPANDQTISVVDPETTRVSSPEKPSRERKKKRKHQENDAVAHWQALSITDVPVQEV